MQKPKIAFIHPSIGETPGGSQIFVLELTEKLKDRCDITILSSKKVNDFCKTVFSLTRKNTDNENMLLYQALIRFLKKYTSTPDIVAEHLTSFFPVLRELFQTNYDIIFPNNDWGGLLVASIVRKIKGTPILFTEHCGFMEKGKIAERNLKFNPDKYVVLSEDLKFWVKKYYPEVSVEYIPNGVDFNKFNPYVQPKFIDMPRPVFLTAARIQPNKRLDLVIEAVSKIGKGSLLMLSSGKNIETLNQKGKSLLGDKRFKLLTVPYNEIASYYCACDIFTLPSLYEPFGLVYLEAMACNKPVVAPNDLSRIDIVGQAGILCDVTDIDIYADALWKAANSDFDDIPYHQARKYTWENTADRYYEVIQSLISDKSDLNNELKNLERI